MLTQVLLHKTSRLFGSHQINYVRCAVAQKHSLPEPYDGSNTPDTKNIEKLSEKEYAPWIKKLHDEDRDRAPLVVKYRRQNFRDPIDRTLGILADDIRISYRNFVLFWKTFYQVFIAKSETLEIDSNVPPGEQLNSKKEESNQNDLQKSKHVDFILQHKAAHPKQKVSNMRRIMSASSPDIFPSHCDVLIIGGGAIGSSIAYHLKKNIADGLNVVMVEKDSTYKESSTVLSVGGIRHQFSLPENILLSMYGMEFLQDLPHLLQIDDIPPPCVNFQPHGYLTLASEKGHKTLQENHYIQKYFRARVEYLEPSQLKRNFPWMNFDGISGGVMGVENEGWFDPWSLLIGLRRKAINLGLTCVEGECVGVNLASHAVETFTDGHPSNSTRNVESVQIKMNDGELRTINPALVILATGHNTGRLAHDLIGIGAAKEGIMAYPIPIEARKRYVYSFHAPKGPGLATPLVIDPTGTYFRREGFGNMFLSGLSPPEHEEPPCRDLEVDHDYFNEKIWPILANRVPAFEELKVQGSWAGFYEYNIFDQNGIIGNHPLIGNLFMAAGFSGHGIQHSLGIGRAMMELILTGEYKSIDLGRFGFERIHLNEPVYEAGIV